MNVLPSKSARAYLHRNDSEISEIKSTKGPEITELTNI